MMINSRSTALVQNGQNKGSIIQTQLQSIVNQINMKGDIWDELTSGRLKYHENLDFEWSASYQGVYYDLYYGKDVESERGIKVNKVDSNGEYKKNPYDWEQGGGRQIYYADEVEKKQVEQPYDLIIDGYYVTKKFDFIIGSEGNYQT